MSTTPQAREWSTATLADLVGGTLRGDASLQMRGVGRIDDAAPDQVTFFADPRYAGFLETPQAGCILVSRATVPNVPEHRTVIIVDDAYRSFVHVMRLFYPPMHMERGQRDATAVIHPTANVDPSASIGPGCVVGERCRIDANVQLYANVVLYADVSIGTDTAVHANVTLAGGTVVGQRCIIHAGAVLGSDGFGYIENADGSFDKIPQVGTVVVGDDVEIGANTTIDRAAVGTTLIGDGVKIDNLVQIAHGVSIGRNSALAAHVAIAGSTRLGERNRFAGQAGIVGHVSTADDVVLHAQSGISKTITTPGHYFGSPALERRKTMRIEAAMRTLPELLHEFEALKRKVDAMDMAGRSAMGDNTKQEIP